MLFTAAALCKKTEIENKLDVGMLSPNYDLLLGKNGPLKSLNYTLKFDKSYSF